MIPGRRERERKSERGGGKRARRKRVRKEGPPPSFVVDRALRPRLMKLSVEDVYRWGLPCVWSIHSDCCKTG